MCVVLVPTKKIGWLNAAAFLVAGYSTAPALIHLEFFADSNLRKDFMMWPWLSGGIIYAVGAIFYANGFPEQCFKETFDIFGHSH
jgi:predicted membrane channel-forming protein YqfA (hemolysin III family)